MKKRSMKKLLAFTSVLMLFLCCFSSAAVADSRRDAPVSVSFDFPAEQIIVHDPEESLGYDAADEYCLAHSSEVTIRFSLPAAADPARSFVQIAYDFYEPHYFTDMPTENGCYVFTSNIDTTATTGYPFSDLQIYINQDYAPDEQWPNHLVNIFADEASLNEWCSYFDGVSWEYPEDTPENPTDVPEDPTDAPEDPTDVPEDPTDVPENPTDVPEDPTIEPAAPTDVPENPTDVPEDPTIEPAAPTDVPSPSVPSTGTGAIIAYGIASIVCGAGTVLCGKRRTRG